MHLIYGNFMGQIWRCYDWPVASEIFGYTVQSDGDLLPNNEDRNPLDSHF